MLDNTLCARCGQPHETHDRPSCERAGDPPIAHPDQIHPDRDVCLARVDALRQVHTAGAAAAAAAPKSEVTFTLWHEAEPRDLWRTFPDRPIAEVRSGTADGTDIEWTFTIEETTSGLGLQLTVFGGTNMGAFTALPEFFTALARTQPDSVAEVAELLLAAGATDVTTR